MRILLIAASLASAAILGGCATSKSGDVYSRDEALREQTVRLATVESVRPVTIQGTRSGIGAAAGAIGGGVAGGGVGHGRGSDIAGVLGAVGGASRTASCARSCRRKTTSSSPARRCAC